MNQAVANIIKGHIGDLDFIDKIAGLVAPLTFEIKGKDNEPVQKTFPIACCVSADDCKEGAYNDLMPNSAYKTVIYFEDGGVSFEREESHWEYYKSTLKLVCWINVAKILGDDCKEGTACTLAAHLIVEIIRALPKFKGHHSPFNHFYSEVTGQEVRTPAIFGAYTYDEKHSQYLMYPFDYFALTIESSFAVCMTGTGVYDSECGVTSDDLDAPVATDASAVAGNSFTANWGLVDQATGYFIDVATDSGFTDLVVNNEDAGNAPTINIEGLDGITTYYYRVRAYNDTTTSENSNTISVITLTLITDIDGNVYTSVIIGTQEWLGENLKTTKYADGTPIPNLILNANWIADVIGAYCWYDNDIGYKEPYGALYSGYAVDNAHGLAVDQFTENGLPSVGWRVPDFTTDWITLFTYVGGLANPVAGKLKEVGLAHWLTPNSGATDEYGFKALPGGSRRDNVFKLLFSRGNHWSSEIVGLKVILHYNSLFFDNQPEYKTSGLSVRCMRDV